MNKVKNIPFLILGVFLLCELVKDFEFLILKTDRTFLAENIFCKLFIIAVIFFCLKYLRFFPDGIGFQKTGFLRGVVLGVTLGVITFSLSYLTEFIVLKAIGRQPELSFYITNFSLTGQNITGISLPALFICLIGNLLNVWAEEGLFRGVLYRLGTVAWGERNANLIQALLFGIWHIIIVIVWIADGSISIPAALLMAVGYMILAGILGYEWGLCAAMTGALWTGISEHFFNNFITNSLHVVTENGADELQILRVVLSNLLSLTIVIIFSGRSRRRKKAGKN